MLFFPFSFEKICNSKVIKIGSIFVDEKCIEYISENKNYLQYLYAVYTKELVEKKPIVSISLSQRFPFDYEAQAIEVMSLNIHYSGSNEYIIKEYVNIRTYNSLYKDKLMLENVDGDIVKKYTSTPSPALNLIYRFTLHMRETTKLTQYMLVLMQYTRTQQVKK